MNGNDQHDAKETKTEGQDAPSGTDALEEKRTDGGRSAEARRLLQRELLRNGNGEDADG